MQTKTINEHVSVAGQITADVIAALKADGFVAIINNRPDGEEFDQPTADELGAAAVLAGIAYYTIPMGREGVSKEMVEQTQAALNAHNQGDGKVLCFCRSGTRSATLWALAQAGHIDPHTIVTNAADAGYDLSHLGAMLEKPFA